jgi:hypothetical protein
MYLDRQIKQIPHSKPEERNRMTEASRQPKDKNYNSISALYQASENAETLKTYLQDSEQESDQDSWSFFNEILENNMRAAQRAREMLVPRLQREQE